MTYEQFRIQFQDSEAAAREAYNRAAIYWGNLKTLSDVLMPIVDWVQKVESLSDPDFKDPLLIVDELESKLAGKQARLNFLRGTESMLDPCMRLTLLSQRLDLEEEVAFLTAKVEKLRRG